MLSRFGGEITPDNGDGKGDDGEREEDLEDVVNKEFNCISELSARDQAK